MSISSILEVLKQIGVFYPELIMFTCAFLANHFIMAWRLSAKKAKTSKLAPVRDGSKQAVARDDAAGQHVVARRHSVPEQERHRQQQVQQDSDSEYAALKKSMILAKTTLTEAARGFDTEGIFAGMKSINEMLVKFGEDHHSSRPGVPQADMATFMPQVHVFESIVRACFRRRAHKSLFKVLAECRTLVTPIFEAVVADTNKRGDASAVLAARPYFEGQLQYAAEDVQCDVLTIAAQSAWNVTASCPQRLDYATSVFAALGNPSARHYTALMQVYIGCGLISGAEDVLRIAIDSKVAEPTTFTPLLRAYANDDQQLQKTLELMLAYNCPPDSCGVNAILGPMITRDVQSAAEFLKKMRALGVMPDLVTSKIVFKRLEHMDVGREDKLALIDAVGDEAEDFLIQYGIDCCCTKGATALYLPRLMRRRNTRDKVRDQRLQEEQKVAHERAAQRERKRVYTPFSGSQQHR